MDIKINAEMSASFSGVEYWYATDDNYDGAPDSNSPMGCGHSKWEAIQDLIGQLEEFDGR